jgi:hypothetical protein
VTVIWDEGTVPEVAELPEQQRPGDRLGELEPQPQGLAMTGTCSPSSGYRTETLHDVSEVGGIQRALAFSRNDGA